MLEFARQIPTTEEGMNKFKKDLDPKVAAEKVRELGRDKAAEYFEMNKSTFRDYLYRNNLPTKKTTQGESKPGVTIKDGNTAEVTSEALPDVSDPEKIVIERGLNPNDWEFSGMTVNEWDSPTGDTLRQLKVQLTRKTPLEFEWPVRTDGPRWTKPKKKKISKDGSLFLFKGDEQAPFHDKGFHEKLMLLIEEEDFHTIVNIGDTNDLPTISRYKSNPEHEARAEVQDCVTAGYGLVRDEREAGGDDVRIIKLIGNHDVRLREIVLEWIPELHGLKRAIINGKEEAPVLSPEFLMRFDELGVECIGDHGSYEHGQFTVSKYLAARHGWIATKGSGSSALKTLEHLGYSIIFGHTHRQSQVFKTRHDIGGNSIELITGVETGCCCRVDTTGLGFAPAPDWQNGAATAIVYPDGKFHIDLMQYVDGELYWRGNRY